MTDRKPAPAETRSLQTLILDLIADAGPGKSVNPNDVAKAAAAQKAKPTDVPDAWRRYTKPVRAEALGLARQGRLTILRKGKPVDPTKPIKGVIRLAAAGEEPAGG